MMPWWSADFAARMPDPAWAALWLRVGWGGVLAALAWALAARLRCPPAPRAVLAAGMAFSCALPGEWAPSFWLGLVWQGPSAALVLWALASMWAPAWAVRAGQAAAPWGAALGGLLLLDGFALWPVFLYPWGFSPWAVALLALAVAAPWVWVGPSWRGAPAMVLVLVALAGFALAALPSGNAWDALLDVPLLAVMLLITARQAWQRWGTRSPG